MKDVVISMHSVHGYDTEDKDVIDFCTDGHFLKEGDAFCFSYMETEVTGMEGTRTSVIVRPDEVVIDRDGLISSRMIFREGERNSFLYSTPYGTATLGINTRKIRHSFNENGGRMEVDYVMDMEHDMVSRNRIILRIEEQKGVYYNG